MVKGCRVGWSRIILLALVLGSGGGLVGEEPLPANYVANGDFEQGDKSWQLVDSKGNKGGSIVTEADGNHALCGQGETYWMAGTEKYFGEQKLENYAGKELFVSFKVKGTEDAYPGIILYCIVDGKQQEFTMMWKTEWRENNIRLTEAYVRYERKRTLPAGTTKVEVINLYNATKRGKIYFDDIRLGTTPCKGKEESPGLW